MKGLSSILCLSLLVSAAGAEDRIKDSPYFPLQLGSQWELRSGEQKLTVRVARHQRLADVQAALLETRDAQGSVVGSEFVAVKGDGVYRYSLNGNRIDPPVCLLKLPPKKGETWKVEARVGSETLKGTFRGGEEEVTVHAGRYKAVTVTTDDATVNDAPFAFTCWYASGIGPVKHVVKVHGKEVVLELEKFTAGTGAP